ncbi:MAG: UPF0175 family protein [Candidatus Altiarchaeales archaeon]|nr:UPF0175 family protein [Candidatus Altiarchaeales archaeon]
MKPGNHPKKITHQDLSLNSKITNNEKKKKMESVFEKGADILIQEKFFSNRKELDEEALRTLFEFRRDLRIAAAVNLYKKEEMSLSRASELAGVSTEEMKDFLIKARVKIRRGTKEKKAEELAKVI